MYFEVVKSYEYFQGEQLVDFVQKNFFDKCKPVDQYVVADLSDGKTSVPCYIVDLRDDLDESDPNTPSGIYLWRIIGGASSDYDYVPVNQIKRWRLMTIDERKIVDWFENIID